MRTHPPLAPFPASLPTLFPALVLAVLVLTLGGCASIVSDNASTTYIQTNPENARCELHGQDFVRVVNTPASINLPSEAAPLTVACKADGYKNTTQVLDTKADGWVWGNLLFGGIIGVAVDAGRGAGQKYPPQFSVVLEPESFPTTAQRDAFYDARRADTEAKWQVVIDKYQSRCGSDQTGASNYCGKVDKAESARDAELMDWEQRRSQARVAAPSADAAESAPPGQVSDLAPPATALP